jgi:hypothetical protein
MTTPFEKRMFSDYGPYRIDEQGMPLLSDVVWDMLEQQEISAEQFGKLFGKITRKNGQPYTKSRIYQMLRHNSFPDDQTRRWVIAKLLQIPPVLMGVSTLDELLPPIQFSCFSSSATSSGHFRDRQSRGVYRKEYK